MATIIPARLTDEILDRISTSGMTEAALARTFCVQPQTLRNGLAGRPTARLIAGISSAYALPLDRIAEFKITHTSESRAAS